MKNIPIEFLKKIAQESIESLPKEIKSKLDNVQVMIQDYPSVDSLKKVGVRTKNGLLGLYHGVPWGKRGTRYANVLPDLIVIYRKPILKICRSKKEIKQKVKEVVLHEIGHYFGFNDTQLENMIKEEENENKGKSSY